MPDDTNRPWIARSQSDQNALARSQAEALASYPLADTYSDREDGADQIDVWAILRTLMRRKFMIIAIVILGVSGTLLLTLRQTPLFRATATLEFQRQGMRIMEGADVDPAIIADADYMATQYELLKSRALAERVVEMLNLTDDPDYVDLSSSRQARVLGAAGAVLGNLTVAPAGRSRVVRVSFVSPDPNKAAMVANSVVESFIASSLERKYNSTIYALQFLEERLVTAKATLEESERQLVFYARQEDIFDVNGEGGNNLDAGALLALNSALTQAQSERIAAEVRYEEITFNAENVDVLDSQELSRLRTLRSELVDAYEEKRLFFKPDYPDMLRLSDRLERTDAGIRAEIDSIKQAAEASVDAAKAREVSLAGRVGALKASLQNERERRIEYTILQRQVDTARTQYDALLQRLKEVSISGGVGASQLSIVDRAIVPGMPFEPNLRRSLIQALILSLGLGVAIAFGLNYIDDTIKTPEDVKQKLGLGTVGVIPRVKGKKSRKKDFIISALANPRSPITEAFHGAKTALEFTTPHGAPRSLLVTSSRSAEGKTSCTMSLGVSFARSGKRVLIIDGDLRKPSFMSPPGASVGLSGILTGDDDLAANIISSETDNLFLLPSGLLPPNPAELLSSSRLVWLIDHAREMFDMVVVGSPQLMGFADTLILGSVCDATVIVIEAGSQRRAQALRLVERHFESRSNVVGVILTKFDARKSGYESSYYYYAYGEGAYNYAGKRSGKGVESRRKVRFFMEEAQGSPDEGTTREA
jgi:capsular exopolysaccharide synthesis family protein